LGLLKKKKILGGVSSEKEAGRLYSYTHETNWFFDLLGRQLLTFCLWARNDLNTSSAEAFVGEVNESGTDAGISDC